MPFGDRTGLKDYAFWGQAVECYFNLVYNPVYDFTTAQTSPCQRLQSGGIIGAQEPGFEAESFFDEVTS